MEDSISSFKGWFEANGGKFHSSVVLPQSGQGLSLCVGSHASIIEPGAALVSCPKKIMMVSSHAQNLFFLLDPRSLASQTIMLRFFVVEQYLLQEESFWWPYIRLLPQPGHETSLHATTLWNKDDLRWLEGINLGQATHLRKKRWREEFDSTMLALAQSAPDIAKRVTWSVCLLVNIMHPRF